MPVSGVGAYDRPCSFEVREGGVLGVQAGVEMTHDGGGVVFYCSCKIP